MLEDKLERIAVALETLVTLAQGGAVGAAIGTNVQTAVDAANAATPPKKPRGRPVGSTKGTTAEEKAGATEGEIVEKQPEQKPAEKKQESFLDENAPSIAELRAALRAFGQTPVASNGGKPRGMEASRGILKTAGNGALRLEKDPKVQNDNQGELQPKYYQAVLDAIKAAEKADEAKAAAEEDL